MGAHLSLVEALEPRCSQFAKEFLRELEGHPKLPPIVRKLLRVEGTIFRADIEEAFLELTKQEKGGVQ